MLLTRSINQARKIYLEYPRQFWIVVGSSFIDQIGGALLFPFFSLYITSKFGVGLTEVGILFSIFSVTGMLGSTLGGVFEDPCVRETDLQSRRNSPFRETAPWH